MNKAKTEDPFALIHEHLHELILQHFDPADVLIYSEVSKGWFDTIGASKRCMRQINLGLENWWQTETPKEISRIIQNARFTTRQYQNAVINCNDDPLVSRQAVRLLRSLAPSLVDLRFLNADKIRINNPFKFPKLERLQFINNVADIDNLLLQSSTRLTELNLKHHYWAKPEPVLECLQQNPHISMLKLWNTGLTQFFEICEPGMLKFRLKRFATGSEGELSPKAEENFLHFLDSQSESLEAIRFRSGLENTVNGKIINRLFDMKAIKIIHLDGIGNTDELKPAVNTRIIELRISSNVMSFLTIKPYLKATPNVMVLFLKKINREILDYAVANLTKLRLIYYTRTEGCISCFNKFLATNEGNKNINLVYKEWF